MWYVIGMIKNDNFYNKKKQLSPFGQKNGTSLSNSKKLELKFAEKLDENLKKSKFSHFQKIHVFLVF